MRFVLRVNYLQKISAGLIVAANVISWMQGSEVVEYIAKDQPLILGRYSIGRFNSLMLILFISCLFIVLLLAKRENFKRRLFKVITVLLALIPALLVVDMVTRLVATPIYYSPQQINHRIADNTYRVTVRDVPKAGRTHSRLPTGYPPIKCTVTMDKRGFRNQTSLDKYDVITLGDSFTEGFYVSDEQSWPAVFSSKSKLSVYNLGMSGADPFLYLQALQKFGQYLGPRIAICMLTEISDFETGIADYRLKTYAADSSLNEMGSHKTDLQPRDTHLTRKIKAYYLKSPLRIAYDNLCKAYLTRVNVQSDVKNIEILSWIPIAIPQGIQAKHYNFTPDRLLKFYKPKEVFLTSGGWNSTAFAIKEMEKICRKANIRFILAYAPDKIHVVLPLMQSRLPADKVRAFAALKTNRKLPPAVEFLDTLFHNLEVQESVVAEFCKKNSIEFVSTTQELRKKVAQGQQMYFTYDTHWTPLGHRVVAEVIYQYWGLTTIGQLAGGSIDSSWPLTSLGGDDSAS
jgi:hypothetical protein